MRVSIADRLRLRAPHVRVAILSIAVLSAARTLPAAAQTPSMLSDRHEDSAAAGTVGLDLSVSGVPGQTMTGVTPLAYGAWLLSEHTRFDFACAIPGAIYSDQGESYFKPGNPMFALHWYTVRDRYAFRVGGAVSFPVANVPGTTGAVDDGSAGREVQLHRVAAQSRGNWDAMLVLPATLAAGVPFHYEALIDRFRLGADVGAYVWICTATDQCESTRFALQGALDGAALVGFARIGARAQFVATSRSSVDETQGSIEPYVEARAGINTWRLSFLMNLDSPGGFSFTTGHVWALHIGVRATI